MPRVGGRRRQKVRPSRGCAAGCGAIGLVSPRLVDHATQSKTRPRFLPARVFAMARQQQSRMRPLLALCVLLSVQMHLCQSAAAADAAAGTTKLPWNGENVRQAISGFISTLSDPYNMQGLWGVKPEQLSQLGLPEEVVKAASATRQQFRERLTSAAGSLAGSQLGDGSLLRAAANTSIPFRVAADGQAVELPMLQAIAVYISQQAEAALKSAATDAASPLAQLAQEQPAAGRKLLGADADEILFESGEGGDEAGALLQAAAFELQRIGRYMGDLADLATELQGDNEGSGSSSGDDDAGASSEARRRLLQGGTGNKEGLPRPENYAQAFRLIFTNVFDLFRANGLYALVPIIADIRGIFGRFNWIADLLNILDAPVENFVNANYWPLPQNNDDFIALVRRFASDYCKFEKATSSEDVLGSFTGPALTYTVKPVSCPIYSDEVTGRSYISFADCDPAQLVINVDPLTVTESYFSAATYTSTECKYTEIYGTDLEFNVGGGAQEFTFRRSAQGIDIVPTVINWDSDLRFFPVPLADANADEGASVSLAGVATEAPGVATFVPTAAASLGTAGGGGAAAGGK